MNKEYTELHVSPKIRHRQYFKKLFVQPTKLYCLLLSFNVSRNIANFP